MPDYLVGEPGHEECDLVTSETPYEAAYDYALDHDCETVEVWDAERCLPEADLAEIFDNNDPDRSPISESWSEYIGSRSMAAIQEGLNELIEKYAFAYYRSRTLIARYKVVVCPSCGGDNRGECDACNGGSFSLDGGEA